MFDSQKLSAVIFRHYNFRQAELKIISRKKIINHFKSDNVNQRKK